MSFTGEYHHTVDAKGRLIVPSRMRDELSGDDVVLSFWLEGCIAMWSKQGWQAIQQSLLELGSSSIEARNVIRQIAKNTYEDRVDKQGRVVIPSRLRERAGITRDVVVIGALNRAEIWSPENYERTQLEEGQFEEMAGRLTF